MRFPLRCSLLLLAGLSRPGLAAPAVVFSLPSSSGWIAVDEAMLGAARGGFDMGGGLTLALGIERLVSINGQLVASSTVDISGAVHAAPAQAQLAGDALSVVTLVQNGAGNVYQGDQMGPALGALVIQNSTNDQLIRSQTTISASVNSLSLLKQVNFENSLREALSGVAAAR